MEDDERRVPWAEHQEKAILGASMVDEQALNDAIEFVEVDDFYLDSHRKVFRVILDISETGNPVDLSLVAEELTRRKELKAIGGVPYLASLSEGLPRKLNVESYCRIVKQKSVLRGLLSVCQIGTTRAYDDAENPQAILEDLEQHILELSQAERGKGFATILDAVKEAGGLDDYIRKTFDPQAMTGLSTGFIEIDKTLGGLQKKEMGVVAGRPGQGKSSWLMSMALNIHHADPLSVGAIFSIEMSAEMWHKRMLAAVAEINVRRASEWMISQEERRRISTALRMLAEYRMMIDDTANISITAMRAKCRRLKQQNEERLDYVGIDYLQLIQGNRKYGNREQEVASISRGIRALSKELDVPVVALAQLGRGSENRGGNKRPMLSDLRESGQIEQDADWVAFVHREEYYAAEDDSDVERGVAEFIFAKNRSGSTGTKKLAYNANITKFMNLEVRHD